MSNRVTHFEIPCDNPQRVMDFFASTFGWKFQQFGAEEYWIAITGAPDQPAGINGAVMKKRDPAQPLVNTIMVDDIEAAMQSIVANGGSIAVPKTPVPGVGWLCYFKDPDGTIHGVWQVDDKAGK